MFEPKWPTQFVFYIDEQDADNAGSQIYMCAVQGVEQGATYWPITLSRAWRFSWRTAFRARSSAAGTSAGSSTRSP